MYPTDSMIYISSDGGPLGTREELCGRLATINTLPDGSESETLYGPGIKVTFLPEGSDEVHQVEVEASGPLEREIAELSFERIENTFQNWVRSFDPAGDDAGQDTEEFFDVGEFLDE